MIVALTSPSVVPTQSLWTGTSFRTTSATSTAGGGGAAAFLSLSLPHPAASMRKRHAPQMRDNRERRGRWGSRGRTGYMEPPGGGISLGSPDGVVAGRH